MAPATGAAPAISEQKKMDQLNGEDTQRAFDRLFETELAPRLRQDGWEVRLEDPPQAYLHLSKPAWGDQRMNGIHFETYVLRTQLRTRAAPVALHCENGCAYRADFLRICTERLKSPDGAGGLLAERLLLPPVEVRGRADTVDLPVLDVDEEDKQRKIQTPNQVDQRRDLPCTYEIGDPASGDCSVIEVQVPFDGLTAAETVQRLAEQLDRFQTVLTPLVDETIQACKINRA
ncbi:unnamed protein product [Amoebophrya sp. A120]|nr:unnamed protein product [Amoebophrya sp. A120]|eukprot:GSA120T00006007001.1